MRDKIRAAIAEIPEAARPFASLLAVVVAYAFYTAVFFFLTGFVDVFAPSGSLHLGMAALGFVLLALRLWVVLVVPALFAYRLARYLTTLATRKTN
jgi:hypothetical protein